MRIWCLVGALSMVPVTAAAEPLRGEVMQRELPYVRGWPPPTGYHLEHRIRRGAALGGGIGFISLYGINAGAADFVALDEAEGAADLLVPVFGPVLYATRRNEPTGTSALLVADSVIQASLLGLFVYGLTTPVRYWKRDGARATVEPTPDGLRFRF